MSRLTRLAHQLCPFRLRAPTDFSACQFNPQLSFLVVVSPQGRVLHANEVALAGGATSLGIFGEPVWAAWWSAGTAGAEQAWMSQLAAARELGAPHSSQAAFTFLEGPRPWKLWTTPVSDKFGVLQYFIVEGRPARMLQFTDLPQSQVLATSAQLQAKLGWAWDLGTDELWLSNEASRILGVSMSDCKGTLTGFLEFVHPDDQLNLQDVASLARSFRGTVSFRCCVRSPNHCAGEPESDRR